MIKWIRNWLGINIDIQRHRQELSIHRQEIQANMRESLTVWANHMMAQEQAQLRQKIAMSILPSLLTHELSEGEYRHICDESTKRVVLQSYEIADSFLKEKA